MNTVAAVASPLGGSGGVAVIDTHGAKVLRSVARELRSAHAVTVNVTVPLVPCGGTSRPDVPAPLVRSVVTTPPVARLIVLDVQGDTPWQSAFCSMRNLIGRLLPSRRGTLGSTPARPPLLGAVSTSANPSRIRPTNTSIR